MKRLIPVLAVVTLAAVPACDVTRTPTQPTTPDTVVNYTAVGASDAIGYGASISCLPFVACPDGLGYVQVVGRRLQSSGKTVTVVNLGIPGAVLSPGVQSLGTSLGRDIYSNFLDNESSFVPKNSTLVTVFAGGNDVNTVGAALDAGVGGADKAGYVSTQTQAFGRDLRSLMTTIKDRAPNARVVFLNLPNMAALPYGNGYSLDQRRWLQQISVSFSSQINALTSQGAIVLDLMCDSLIYRPSSYSGDGFHPNDAGYAYLADVVYAAAGTGTRPAPASSCAQMVVY